MKQKFYPKVAFLSILLLIQFSLFSQQFHLVRDVQDATRLREPRLFTVSNNNLFYAVNEGSSGTCGLYKVDESTDVITYIRGVREVTNIADVNGVIYFYRTVQTGQGSVEEFYKTDGTVAGTALITGSPLGANIANFTNLNGILYFTSQNILRKSDGTVTGTVSVIGVPSNISSMINVNGVLFFLTRTGLWKSDGTAAGTTAVKDGFVNGSLHDLYQANGSVYFVADDGINGSELWKSDGTLAGTVLVKDITTGATGTSVHHFSVLNSEIFFAVDDPANGGQLWKTDGTGDGTQFVKNIYPGVASSKITSLATVNNSLYVAGFNGTLKYEVWKSDGTDAGTVMFKDFFVDKNPYARLENLIGVNNTLYFSISDGLARQELWKSDGTPAGTIMIKNHFVPTIGSDPANLANFNGVLYCAARNQLAGSDGIEPWKSDGTYNGTLVLKNISPLSLSSFPKYFTPLNNSIIFSCSDGGPHGYELWISNGTVAGTGLLKDINPYGGTIPDRGSNPANLLVINQALYFTANDWDNGYELWKTDGTTAGTVMVKNINPGVNNSNPSSLVNLNGILYFAADNGTDGKELWKSDGTDAGTVMIKNINTAGGSNPAHLTAMNGKLYFVADDGTNGIELWESDGTDAGTTLLKDINSGGNGDAASLTAINNVLYFSANDGSGNEVWKSDGTTAGTVLVKDINPGTIGSNPSSFSGLNGFVLFVADNGTDGKEIWKTDGTTAGTVLLKDINAGGSSNPSVFTKVGNNLLFAADDGIHGSEVWITNGIEVSTRLFQDVEPGANGSIPSEMIVINSKVYASLTTTAFGRELWIAEAPADSPLPLTLLEFKGSVVDNDGVLQWKTDNEMNTASFIIERSIDGRHYSSIGSVASVNSPGIHYYDFTDADITSVGIADFYYRLKQTDIDGKYTYSNIVVLSVTSGKNFVLLYPNPVKNKINMTINVSQKEKMQWQLTDNMGRRVKAGNYDLSQGSMAVSIDISNLSSGMYLIQLNSSSLQKTIKLVKQ